jgi:hypothetical protein
VDGLRGRTVTEARWDQLKRCSVELETSGAETGWVGRVRILSIGDIVMQSEVYGSGSIPAQGSQGVSLVSFGKTCYMLIQYTCVCINVQMRICIHV